MTSNADLPSCSKMIMAEKNYLPKNKYPVVLLIKLDPGIISVNLNTENMQQFQKQQYKKDAKLMLINDDEDIVLSDVCLAFSDDEKMVSEEAKSMNTNLSNWKSTVNESDKSQKKYPVGKKLPEDGKSNQKALPTKHPVKSDGTIRKEILEKIIPYQDPAVQDRKYNSNARYKLALDQLSVSAMESESFRKFVNLALDCVLSFNKKQNTSGPVTGNVVLFFGDFLTLQSAIQRLSHLSVFTDKALVKGCITCMELTNMNKNVKKDEWKAVFLAKLFFNFNTGKREMLQQLVSNKGLKKEDTKRKCVQIHRTPSPINEEMLSLLFPFSLGVKISCTDSSEKDIKGPVEIEFKNQEWMDAVFSCFKDFNVSTKLDDRPFNLIIKNFVFPKEKSAEKSFTASTPTKQKQVTSIENKSITNQRDRNKNEIRDTKPRNTGLAFERSQRPLLQRTSITKPRNDQLKRTISGTSFGQRRMNSREPAVKRNRLDNKAQVREPTRMDMIINEAQSQAHANAQHDALCRIAHSRGLDPNNPDVLKVLEMSTQLEQLQNMVEQKNAEVQSFGAIGLPGPQHIVNEYKLHLQQQEEAEARRIQAHNLQLREIEEAQINLIREEEELILRKEFQVNMAEINRREMLLGQRKQLEELELLSRQEVPFPLNRIKTYGHAPPTGGLLGAAPVDVPSVYDEQQIAHENIYSAKNRSGFNRQNELSLKTNMSHNKPHPRQSSTDKSTLNKRLPQKSLLNQRSPNSNAKMLRMRSQNMRTNEGTKQTPMLNPNSYDQMPGELDRNDTPRNCNRALDRLTQEHVFKHDSEWARAMLAYGNEATGTSFQPKSILKAARPLLEEVRDRHSQFGTNVAQRIPAQSSDDRRNNLQMNQNILGRGLTGNNARSMGSGHDQSFKDGWEIGAQNIGGRKTDKFQDFNEHSKNDVRRHTLGAHAELANIRGLMAKANEVNLPRALPNLYKDEISVQRGRSEHVDAYEYSAQLRRNVQDRSRGNDKTDREHEAVGSLDSSNWKQPRQRSSTFEERQLHSESVDFRRNEWNKHGEKGKDRRGVDFSNQPGLLATPPLLYEDSYSAQSRKPSHTVQKLARVERDHGNFNPVSFAGDAGYGKDEIYQASYGIGNKNRVSQSGNSGRGNSAQGVFHNARQNNSLPEPGRGRGLLDLPGHTNQQESKYYRESNGSRYNEAADGNYQTNQHHSYSRNNSLMLPPQPPPALIRRGVNFY